MANERTILASDLVRTLNLHAQAKFGDDGCVVREMSVFEIDEALRKHGIGLCDNCLMWTDGIWEIAPGFRQLVYCPKCAKLQRESGNEED